MAILDSKEAYYARINQSIANHRAIRENSYKEAEERGEDVNAVRLAYKVGPWMDHLRDLYFELARLKRLCKTRGKTAVLPVPGMSGKWALFPINDWFLMPDAPMKKRLGRLPELFDTKEEGILYAQLFGLIVKEPMPKRQTTKKKVADRGPISDISESD